MNGNRIERYWRWALAILCVGVFVWFVCWAVGQDETNCAELGGHLLFKSAGSKVVEFCLSDDGRILR